jgi:hypothetical protein
LVFLHFLFLPVWCWIFSLRALSLLIRIRCPAHASLLALMQLTVFETLNSSYN